MKLVDRIKLWFWTSPRMEFASRLWCPFMRIERATWRLHMRCEHGGPCVKGCYDSAEAWKCPACGLEFDNQLLLDDHVEEYHGSYARAKGEGAT